MSIISQYVPWCHRYINYPSYQLFTCNQRGMSYFCTGISKLLYLIYLWDLFVFWPKREWMREGERERESVCMCVHAFIYVCERVRKKEKYIFKEIQEICFKNKNCMPNHTFFLCHICTHAFFVMHCRCIRERHTYGYFLNGTKGRLASFWTLGMYFSPLILVKKQRGRTSKHGIHIIMHWRHHSQLCTLSCRIKRGILAKEAYSQRRHTRTLLVHSNIPNATCTQNMTKHPLCISALTHAPLRHSNA